MASAPAQTHTQVDVEVDLEVGDVVSAAIGLFVHRARYAVAGYAVALVVVLLLLEYGGLPSIPDEILRPLAISLILLPLFLFGFVYWNTTVQFAHSKKPGRSMRYHFCADSLDVHSESRGGFLPWFAFHEAMETKSSFLLFLSPHEHYLIPKRCFREPGDVGVVRGILREQMGRKAHLSKA